MNLTSSNITDIDNQLSSNTRAAEAGEINNACLDDALVAKAKGGDKAAFKLLYQRHQGRVYAICLRLSGSADHADEICQDCFVRLWQKLNQFNGDSQFTTWLYKLCVHQAINSMKAKQSFWHRFLPESSLSEHHQSLSENHQTQNGHQEYHRLDKLIMQLPQRTRVVFVLCAIEGYQHDEVAQILDIAVGTSKAQYHRAKQMLQEMLV